MSVKLPPEATTEYKGGVIEKKIERNKDKVVKAKKAGYYCSGCGEFVADEGTPDEKVSRLMEEHRRRCSGLHE